MAPTPLRPNPYLLVTMVAWGFNFVALKFIYHEVNPPALGLVRFGAMALVLVLLCRVQGEEVRYPKHNGGRILVQGFLSMGVYMVLFLEGMKRIGAAEGAIILATTPILTAFVAASVKQERLVFGTLLGSFVAMSGVFLVVGVGAATGHMDWLGVGLLFASAIVWAVATVISKPLVSRVSPLKMLTLSMPGALVVLVPYGLADAIQTPWTDLTTQTWLMIAHVTALAGVVGFMGFYRGVQQVGASAAMMYQYLVPILAALFSWWALGSGLRPLQWAGVIVVLGGVGYASWVRTKLALQGALRPEP
ncbi:MAG: DMT family transporter [Fimbriimonadaceae bacterium]|nr:DMT family transporter [Fimbriimonadaceae bacterium]